MNWKILSKKSGARFLSLLFFYSLKMQASNFPQPSQQEKMCDLERVVRQSTGFMNNNQPFYLPTIIPSSLSADDYNRQSIAISDAMSAAGFEPMKMNSFSQFCATSCIATMIVCTTPCAPKTVAQIRYNYLVGSAQSVIEKYRATTGGIGTGYVQLDDDNDF